jgi:hypothetical protein
MKSFKEFLTEAKLKPAFSDPMLKDNFSNLNDLAQMHDHVVRGKPLPKKLKDQVEYSMNSGDRIVDAAVEAIASLAAGALVIASDQFNTSNNKEYMISSMKTKQDMMKALNIEKMLNLSDNMDLLVKKNEATKFASKITDEYIKNNNITS